MSSAGSPGRSGVGAPSPDGKGLGPHSPTSPATPNPTGRSPRAAVAISNARAEASRKNGAKSRGPKTPEGKARSAQNALKHGLRAQKHVVLPEEDAAEFADLETALIEELAPVGALQTGLARRVAVAAWRLARADRIEVELFAERHIAGGGLGLALIRDGNGTRSFETLLRYRGAAMAAFWRALRTLKALQAEAGVSLEQTAGAALALETRGSRALARRPRPNEPEPREISSAMSGSGAGERARAAKHLARTPGTLDAKRTRAAAHPARTRSAPAAERTHVRCACKHIRRPQQPRRNHAVARAEPSRAAAPGGRSRRQPVSP